MAFIINYSFSLFAAGKPKREQDANETQLEIAAGKLKKVAKSLIDNWNLRQTKSRLQEATQKVFGQIHDIELLPQKQSESVVVQECYPGFLEWNKYWSESFNHFKIKKKHAMSVFKIQKNAFGTFIFPIKPS